MTLLTTALLSLALAQSEAPPAVDVPLKDKLLLLTDGKSRYLAVVNDASGADVFMSDDGKVFNRVRMEGRGRNGFEFWSVALWEPRLTSGDGQHASIEMRNTRLLDGGFDEGKAVYSITCARKTKTLTLVPPADAKKMLDAAKFTAPVWTRRVEKLLRDDKGTYYFVDRVRSEDPYDRRDFRVFVGQKGAMKQLPLKDIVDDSMGMVFATKNGNLRLVTAADGKFEGKWVQGKASTALLEVDLNRYDTSHLIYLDLGPYTGARLGTPCDDFN